MTHLKVAVRVRPLSLREIEAQSTPILAVEHGKTIAITNIKVPEQNVGDSRERTRRFTFDYCFHENSTQDDVFEAVEAIIGKAVRRRYNSCVLAYGQSSSGKTHTMMGFPHDPGLTPRLCRNVFDHLRDTAVGEGDTSIAVSYLEIYNEKVRDLLRDSQITSAPLKIRQHPKKGPYVQGLTEHSAPDPARLLELLQTGNERRRVAATSSNLRSSRSHSVFIVCCGNNAKLTLVDLAGSERAGSGNSDRCFREGANINKSLVALGNVISTLATEQLSKGNRRRFIPYRDSVLTWLLKDTLGGNSTTVMIATISPSNVCYSETVNTLRFGQRAKLIVSAPVVNEDPNAKTIRELRAEIARLKELIANNIPSIQMSNQSSASTPQGDQSPQLSTPSEESTIPESTEPKLMPVIDVVASEVTKPKTLRRTFSTDLKKPPRAAAAAAQPLPSSKRFGSADSIKQAPASTSSRRSSIADKTKLIQRNKPAGVVKKTQGTVTEARAPLKVESRVDSIRKTPAVAKPRSQIVAAVTSRLYAKTKKKDMATDTHDIGDSATTEQPEELSICSNARLRLKELTRKALRVHRSKETQTDRWPVLRVKETATDVEDLQIALEEMKHVDTSTEAVATEDKATSCDTTSSIVVTRTCGTSTETKPSSFTKYLLLDLPENTIYAECVNINIAHNYNNDKKISSESIECDSLDEERLLLGFPTPDLISNHNSLEGPIKHNSFEFDPVFHVTAAFSIEPVEQLRATCSTIDDECQERYCRQANVATVCASEVNIYFETCEPLPAFERNSVKPKVTTCIETCDGSLSVVEHKVLKSIMRDDEQQPDKTEQKDEEHNKQVRFPESNVVLKAMSTFLEEATSLMSNLKVVASQLDKEQEYEVQVTIDGLQRKRKKKKCPLHHCEDRVAELKTDNKFEALLEDSCRRLEEKINMSEQQQQQQQQQQQPAMLMRNQPNVWVEFDDTSLESNHYSDYGSLPRRRYRRRPSCSPSAFLRQLAAMRREVVENSREELALANNNPL